MQSAQPGGAPSSKSRWRSTFSFAAALSAVIVLILFGRGAVVYVPRFAAFVGSLGGWGPAVFIAGYALAAVAFVPGSILTLAAGALFGLWRGTAYVLIGATGGACLAFLVSRYLARRVVERRIGQTPAFAAIDRAVARDGRKIVFLLRLSPLIPFNLLNYTLGLTQVKFRDYLLACVGMLPGTLLYVYYGKLAGDVAALASGSSHARGAADYAVLAIGLIATIAVTTLITRLARRALKEAADV